MSVNIYSPESLPVPVKIIVEPRSTSRVALGKNEIIVRLPKHFSVVDKEKTLQQFLGWAKKQIAEKKYYQEKQNTPESYQGRVLRIYNTDFKVELEYIKEGKSRLSYRGDTTLKIYLLKTLDQKKQVAEIQRFLLRFAERYFLPHIQQRTLYWNQLYFKEKIEKIVLTHTVSCWGSCTTKRRVAFSTKLLLMPQDAIDYVIIHELAHLKEMNHSPKFWKHVEAVMPDYKEKKKWLQDFGIKIDF